MKRFLFVVMAVIVLAGFGLGAQSWWRATDPKLVASGTLEARNITLGSKVGGRVKQVLVEEGQTVEAGRLLVAFEDTELAARVIQARGRLEAAKANLAKLRHGFRPEEIEEAQAAAEGYHPEEINQLRSELERARAEQVNAGQNFQRVDRLVAEGVFARQLRDDAEARLKSSAALVRAAEHAVNAADARLRAARAVATKTQRGFRQEEIDAARAEVLIAQGVLKEAEALFSEREVRAPGAAVVEVLDLRPGDLVSPNSPVAKLLEAGQLYVIVYVPQRLIGQVRVGQQAEVRVDSFTGEAFAATVEQIRQKAEFLPRNVQTAEEREHQVIGVKLGVENRNNALRAGIHADVTFPEGL